MNKLPHIKKIAILRANALGDLIFALPALHAIKQTYPEAQITLLGRQWHKDFLTNRPSSVDRVIVLPRIKGVSMPDTFEDEDSTITQKCIEELRKEDFDIAVQIHGGGRFSNPFINQLGADLTVGLATPDAEPLNITIPYVYYQSEILRYLEVARQIGATTTNLTPSLSITEQDIKDALPYLPKTPFIVLHPGASDLRRRWEPLNFAKVGDYFARLGYVIVITGSEKEQTITSEVASLMEHPAHDLTGKLSLGELSALLSKAQLVIANDTGPLHLANAVGAKTVGIFWCGNLINGDPINRITHHPALSWIIHCPLCAEDIATGYPMERNADGCQHDVSFVNRVSLEEVISLSEQLLPKPHLDSAITNSLPL